MNAGVHMSRVAVAAIVLGLGVAAPAVAGERLEKEEKLSLPAADRTGITIKNARGRTVVVGRSDANAVSIVAVKTVIGKDEEDARAMMDRLSVDVSERGDEIVVETRDGNKYDDWSVSLLSVVKGSRRSGWIDYTIEVPYAFGVAASTTSGEVRVSNIGARADVSATSGDVSIRGVAGTTRAHLTSGDLEVSDVGGDLSVAATSGNVEIDGVRGSVELRGTSGDFQVSRVGKNADIQLTSGDLVLEGCSGDVVFRAASGDARLSEIGGSLDASSSSGDIEALVTPLDERRFVLSTSSGDVDLYYVPVRDYGFHLDVRTSSGSIEGEMPIKVNRVDRRRLQGVVGSGVARIQIETASGDISIMEKSDAANKPAR